LALGSFPHAEDKTWLYNALWRLVIHSLGLSTAQAAVSTVPAGLLAKLLIHCAGLLLAANFSFREVTSRSYPRFGAQKLAKRPSFN